MVTGHDPSQKETIVQRKISDWGGVIAAFVFVIALNGLANALPINGQTTGEVSDKYPSLFTPAGYTFSIWGLIYLGLLVYVVYQALPAQRQDPRLASVSGPFMLNCAANAAWILAWHYDFLWLSLLLMLVVLGTLVQIYRQLCIADASARPGQRYCVQLPFGIYMGWISVATIANISALQIGMGWDDIGLDAVNWTLVKLAVAGAIGATVVLRRRDVAFALVVAWAALGIAVKQTETPEVAGAAGALSILATLLAASELVRRLRPSAA